MLRTAFRERSGVLSTQVLAEYFVNAAVSGCTVPYTEDLQHGQTVRGVRIENPFRA